MYQPRSLVVGKLILENKKSMSKNLSKNILKTVCYYDVLNYPLTLFEIWKYLVEMENLNENEAKEYSLSEVLRELTDNNNLKAFIKSKNGFYFLKGRDDLVEKRIKKDKISVRKIKRLRKWVYILRMVPFVRAIFITGRLAMKNAHPSSDWDVLVVLKRGRIWVGRTALTLATHLLLKRRYRHKTQDRFCLNYFITDNSLEIRNKDLFSASEYSFCFPIFDSGDFFKKFQLKNGWIKKYKPNYFPSEVKHLKCISDTPSAKRIRNFLEKILDSDSLEKYLRKIELRKIKQNPKTSQTNSFIVADDDALIFLPDPQGPKIFEKFKENIAKL